VEHNLHHNLQRLRSGHSVAKLYTIHPQTPLPKDIIAIVSTSPHGHTKALCQDMEYINASTTYIVSVTACSQFHHRYGWTV
jgi:hypothetical protein